MSAPVAIYKIVNAVNGKMYIRIWTPESKAKLSASKTKKVAA